MAAKTNKPRRRPASTPAHQNKRGKTAPSPGDEDTGTAVTRSKQLSGKQKKTQAGGRPRKPHQPLFMSTVEDELASARARLEAAGFTTPLPPPDTPPIDTQSESWLKQEALLDNGPPAPEPLRTRLLRIHEEYAERDPKARVEAKQAAIFEELERVSMLFGSLPGSAPVVPMNLSTGPLRAPGHAPSGAKIRGGHEFDLPALHRSFALLLDLMSEAHDGLARAKPDCVNETARAFVSLMSDFAKRRQQAAQWVRAHQLVPALEKFYENWKNAWPKKQSPLRGSARIPVDPTPEEEKALLTQERDLELIALSVGFNIKDPNVRKRLMLCRASAAYISPTTGNRGPRRAAYEAAGWLCAVEGGGLSGSSVEKIPRTRSHVELVAHNDS